MNLIYRLSLQLLMTLLSFLWLPSTLLAVAVTATIIVFIVVVAIKPLLVDAITSTATILNSSNFHVHHSIQFQDVKRCCNDTTPRGCDEII
jgi:hypothetical protein